jgi:glycine cleavage system H protein
MLIAGCRFPEGLWYHAEHQVWACFEGAEAVVGITELGIRLAGEIYMCRPKSVGSEIEQGRSIAVVELAKSIVSVKSPLQGVVTAVNPRLAAEPECVHRDPFGDGWLARLRPTRWPQDGEALVQGEAVAAAMQRMAWLNSLA